MIETKINNDFFINSFKVVYFIIARGIVRKYLSNQFTIEYIVIRDFILIVTTIYGLKHGLKMKFLRIIFLTFLFDFDYYSNYTRINFY